MFGLLPGLTQYKNHWHFCSDVLVGNTIGILLALFAYFAIRNFDKSTTNLSLTKDLKTNSNK